MSSIHQHPKWQYTRWHSTYDNATAEGLRISAIRRANTPTSESQEPALEKPLIRTAFIFGCVILFSLLAAFTGCIIAHWHGSKRRARCKQRQRTANRTHCSNPASRHDSSSADHSSEFDLEMLSELDTITANDNFRGREWNAYKKEMRAKAKRQARGAVRTSQGVPLPINIHQLKGRMRDIPRSFLRSMTRSDTVHEPIPEPVAFNELLERLRSMSPISQSNATQPKSGHRHALSLTTAESPKVPPFSENPGVTVASSS